MKRSPIEKRKVGDLRPSQLLHTFGVGAIVELPHLSTMVMGLDDWPIEQGSNEINEPRLLRAVRNELGPQVARLLTPPATPETTGYQSNPFDDLAHIGVPVAPFPRWLLCPSCRLLAPISSDLFELKAHKFKKEQIKYVHRNCNKSAKPPTAIPARFLVACANGHLDDFPWVEYVHRGKTDCRGQLTLYELGASGEVADIQAQCSCGRKRRMSDAFDTGGEEQLGPCRGRWPHLRKFSDAQCREAQRGILLGASNSWFPIMLTALSIPAATDRLAQLIDQNWGELGECESPREIKLKRKLLRGLTAYTEEEIWEAVGRKRQLAEEDDDEALDLRTPEWRVFSNPDPKRNSRDFQLRPAPTPPGYADVLEKVVLVERLREVRSLIGFTRIESPGDFTEISELPSEHRAPLSRQAPRWAPTSDVRGEGIFLQFSETALRSWLKSQPELERDFFRAHKQWRRNRKLDEAANYPGLRYILLHSLAHALIRQFSIECGYTTASIRERIYSRNADDESEPMAGILLYTAAPDSEGTLGGLVSLGAPETLGRHLDQALEEMQLCSSDPLCAEHRPYQDRLHAAACHACLFLPETSCERGNKYLDRSVLVATVEHAERAFFSETEKEDAIPKDVFLARTNEPIAPAQPLPAQPAYAELVETCDERYQDFAQAWAEAGLPWPEIGYELQDESGRIRAQAELAWPAKKIAVLPPETLAEMRPAFEAQGWQVLNGETLTEEAPRLRAAIKE